MKKILVAVILVFVLMMGSFSVLAADMEVNVNDEGTTDQEDPGEEIKIDFDEKDKDWGFKGNGGPMLAGLMLDFSSLNKALESANNANDNQFSTFDDDYMLLFGGGGVGGFKNGSRFGGYGAEGKLTTTNGVYKSTLTINYGGFLYEKGILSFKKRK